MRKYILQLSLVLWFVPALAQNDWQRYYADNRAVFVRDSLYGYVDGRGEEVISRRFDRAYPFNNGIAMVRHGYESFAIDTTGRRLDCRVTIPRFRNRDLYYFNYFVHNLITFTSTDEYRRLMHERIVAEITISTDGRITACRQVGGGSAEAFAKVREAIGRTAAWRAGAVDDLPCEIRYPVCISFSQIPLPQCTPIDGDGRAIVGRDFVYPLFDHQPMFAYNMWFFRHMWFKNRDDYYRATSGRVRVSFTIDTRGRVGNVRILESHNPVCSRKAEENLLKSPRWTPALLDGKPVAVRCEWVFNFRFRS